MITLKQISSRAPASGILQWVRNQSWQRFCSVGAIMGLLWFLAWAIGGALLLEALLERYHIMAALLPVYFIPWIAALFVGRVIISAVGGLVLDRAGRRSSRMPAHRKAATSDVVLVSTPVDRELLDPPVDRRTALTQRDSYSRIKVTFDEATALGKNWYSFILESQHPKSNQYRAVPADPAQFLTRGIESRLRVTGQKKIVPQTHFGWCIGKTYLRYSGTTGPTMYLGQHRAPWAFISEVQELVLVGLQVRYDLEEVAFDYRILFASITISLDVLPRRIQPESDYSSLSNMNLFGVHAA